MYVHAGLHYLVLPPSRRPCPEVSEGAYFDTSALSVPHMVPPIQCCGACT